MKRRRLAGVRHATGWRVGALGRCCGNNGVSLSLAWTVTLSRRVNKTIRASLLAVVAAVILFGWTAVASAAEDDTVTAAEATVDATPVTPEAAVGRESSVAADSVPGRVGEPDIPPPTVIVDEGAVRILAARLV